MAMSGITPGCYSSGCQPRYQLTYILVTTWLKDKYGENFMIILNKLSHLEGPVYLMKMQWPVYVM